MEELSNQQTQSTLRDYLQVVRRRRWIIVVSALLVPAAALGYSLRESAQYQGSAQVLLNQQDLGSQLTGSASSSGNEPVTEVVATQAEVAHVPAVAERAIQALHLTMTPQALLGASSVSASATSDILTFDVSDHDPVLASRLATAYAQAYVAYGLAVETSGIAVARKDIAARLADTPAGPLRNSLIEKDETLQEMQALTTADASVIRAAGSAVQTAPRTARDVVLGLALGIVLGIGMAFLRESLDTRVRSGEAVAELLGLPLLARLPEPPRKLRSKNRLVMLDEPSGDQAESFRMLRTNLEFVMLGKGVKTIVVTSAVEKEGKSTTAANLALAMARGGQRVVLVDVDLRRPFIDQFFDLQGASGLTEIALGRVSLDEALASVPLALEVTRPTAANGNGNGNGSANGNGHGDGGHGRVEIRPNGAVALTSQGSLQVITSGPIPPDPGDFVGTEKLAELIAELRRHADVVILDTPPLLHVGDGLILSSHADAVVVVTRMEIVRRPMLTELRRLLDTTPARKLGFVITGAEAEDGYGSSQGGYTYYGSYRSTVPAEVRS